MPALLKPEVLSNLDVTIKGAFLDAYSNGNYQPKWSLVATRQTSGSRKNVYPQAIDAATIREWSEGERVINGIVIRGAEVTNQTWELTYSIKREDLDDDMSGTVAQAVSRVRSGAAKYLRHPDKLVFNVLKANGTSLDGLALFSASHLENPSDPGSSTFSNTSSGALTPANVAAARAKMLELKGPDGDPLNEEPNTIIVPPALETTARRIAQADMVIDSATATDNAEFNVYKGAYTVLVVPHLAASFTNGSDSYWYLADTSDPEDRGLIFQEREAVELVSLFSPTDPNVFERNEYVWGTRARYTAAAGNPKRIFRRTG
jgi:phage major head subunit gpT-like protein